MFIGGLTSTSSATAEPSNPRAEFGAVSLLVKSLLQAFPVPVTALVQVPGRLGASSPSKFSVNFGPQVSPIVQALPSLQALVLLLDTQRPVVGLHASVVHTSPSGTQTTGFWPTQTPF